MAEQTPPPIVPYLAFRDASEAIDFYTEAFDVSITHKMVDPEDGRIGHAEMQFPEGGSVMLSDEYPDFGAISAETLGGCPVNIQLYVGNCDVVIESTVAAGATLVRPPEDQFFGMRMGSIVDPFGYKWTISTLTENISGEEAQARWEQMTESGAGH